MSKTIDALSGLLNQLGVGANQNAFSHIKVGDVLISAAQEADEWTIAAGGDIRASLDVLNKKINFNLAGAAGESVRVLYDGELSPLTQISAPVIIEETYGDFVSGTLTGLVVTSDGGLELGSYQLKSEAETWTRTGSWTVDISEGSSGNRVYSGDYTTPAKIEVTVNLPWDGYYEFTLNCERDNYRAIVEFLIDGVSRGTFDQYSPSKIADANLSLGTFYLTAGNHTLTLRHTGTRNASSAGWYIEADYVLVERDISSGTRVSPVYDLSQVGIAASSTISWNATLPANTSLTIETNLSLDGGATWQGWQACANGGPVPGITAGTDLSNARLQVRQTFSTGDISVRPSLRELIVWVDTGVNISVSQVDYGQWVTRASMPTARHHPAAGVINGVLYVVGGGTATSALSTNEAYDSTTDTWATKAAMPVASCYLAAGVINNILYAVGGYAGSSNLSNNQAYDPVTNTWSAKANMPTARQFLAAGVINNILYAVGGYDGTTHFSTNEAYDLITNTWSIKTSMPTARTGLSSSVIGDILYAIGGHNGVSQVSINESYDPATNTWTTKASMPVASSSSTAGVIDGFLYVVGGNPGPSDVNQCYDPVNNAWFIRGSALTKRAGAAGGVIDGVLYVTGGGVNTTYFNTTECYIPTATRLVAFALGPAQVSWLTPDSNFLVTVDRGAGLGTVQLDYANASGKVVACPDGMVKIYKIDNVPRRLAIVG
ncbi:MAG: hypothetical protein AB1330_01220 [Bacillota bacterium]